MIKKILYEGKEVECEVRFNWFLLFVWFMLTIFAPLVLVSVGLYPYAAGLFVLAVLGILIGGHSQFYEFEPINEENENE